MKSIMSEDELWLLRFRLNQLNWINEDLKRRLRLLDGERGKSKSGYEA